MTLTNDSIWKRKNKRLFNNTNKMILKTTNREDFTDFVVVPHTNRLKLAMEQNEERKPLVIPENHKFYINDSKEFRSTLSFTTPVSFKSCYNNNFKDYGLYINHHERHPQYPLYQLPFKGDSVYKESFVNNLESQLQKAKDWNHTISAPSLDPKEIRLKVSADHIKPKYSIAKMERTTKMYNPQEMQFTDVYKAKSYKPKDEVVENMVIPVHFQTTYRNEFDKKEMIKRRLKKRLHIVK